MRRRASGRESGASLVEFALIVPLLTLFLFGIVQFGLAYDKKQSINSAAREGARTASIPDNDFADIDVAVRSGFQGLDDDDTLTVQVTSTGFAAERVGDATPSASQGNIADPPCEDNAGDPVIVTVTVDHVLTIPFFGAPTITIEGRGEFRCEAPV